MGRKLRSTIPISLQLLRPKLPNHLQVKEKEKLKNIKQKRNFDKRRKVIQYIPLIREM